MACRLCLNKPGEVLEIFKQNGELAEGGAIEVIEKYFQIQIKFNDEISNKICLVCWRYLNEFHKFWLNIKEKQQTLQLALDCTRIKRETPEDTAHEQIKSTFEEKNDILCEPELNIDDIKEEPNLAVEFDDDSMNEDSSLLPPQDSDACKKENENDVQRGATVEEVKEIVRQETKSIIEIMHKETKTLIGQMQVLLEEFAEQSAILKSLYRQQGVAERLSSFPIKNLEELSYVNSEINDGKREAYIEKMRTLLQPGGVRKQLKFILSDEVITNTNIDGLKGKVALKSFNDFYNALIESIPLTEGSDTAELQLRKAITRQKNRNFKQLSAKK